MDDIHHNILYSGLCKKNDKKHFEKHKHFHCLQSLLKPQKPLFVIFLNNLMKNHTILLLRHTEGRKDLVFLQKHVDFVLNIFLHELHIN